MPHATPTRGAWIRPHARPAPPPKPTDPIASNLSLLQYFAGGGSSTPRHRSTSPTKPLTKPGKQTHTQAQAPPKVKLPKELGLEGLEALQYRPPPPPESVRREVVEVAEELDEEEGTEYADEERDGGTDVMVITPARGGSAKAPQQREVRYHHASSVQQPRSRSRSRSYYRSPPPSLPSPPKLNPSTTDVRADLARRAIRRGGGGAGPIAHVAVTRHMIPDPVGARAALERGIRERRLEREGRQEREVGYAAAHPRGGGREVARVGSGSRAMREAITPLVM